MDYFIFATVYIEKMSLKGVMKFTTVWFLKNEVAIMSLWSVFGSHRNEVGLLFSYIYENTPFNSKETCFLGNQCMTDRWKPTLNSKLSKVFFLLSNTNLSLYSWLISRDC